MGEVYLARDQKLGRDVAIKILPGGFINDRERLARFEREAKLLASLNHPNVAAIYGFEEHEGLQYIVMELVPGQTLAEQIALGPIPLTEALEIGRQIAEALEAAHEKGVIHRDLKPPNVKITDEEKVKVLDFGLAKVFEEPTSDSNISESPTQLQTGTRPGVILGTVAYMSPEQAKGKAVDKRTDIFSFGCVLYEMLSGKAAFNGETVSDILAAVIRAEPDWNALPISTPQNIRGLLRRCLQKDRKRRLHDIGDARIEIEDALNEPSPAQSVPTIAAPHSRRAILFGLSGLAMGIVLAGLGWWLLRSFLSPRPSAISGVTRLAIPLSDAEPLALTKFAPLAIGRRALAISSDGSKLVYVVNRNGTAMLSLRPLDKFEGKPISGTQGAYNPFFSPDGTWVAFFADNKLKKVSLAGGEPVTLCEARNPVAGSWAKNDEIFFADQEGGIVRQVSAAGGSTRVIEIGGDQINELEVLPDGKWLLYSSNLTGSPDYAVMMAFSLETGQRLKVLEGGCNPHYLAPGYLLYTRAGSLMAGVFDLSTHKLTGPAATIVEGIRAETYGNAQFSVSENGTLVYVSGTAGWIGKPVWVDRQGNVTPIALPAQVYQGQFRLSSDGKRLVIPVSDAKSDIWVYEFERGTFLRLTVDGTNFGPTWSPDGKRIAFTSVRNGKWGIFWKAADGTGDEEQIASSELGLIAESWSPDGKSLTVATFTSTDAGDIWTLPLEGDRKLQPFLRTQFSEFFSSFSPDGRWIVYTSDESGRYEVYVRPYTGSGRKWQVSTEGGEEPVWSANGQELFYRYGEKWMAATVQTKGEFHADTPRLLFEKYFINVPGISHWPTADGQRQVVIQPIGDEVPPKQINVVLNWVEELKQRLPPGKR